MPEYEIIIYYTDSEGNTIELTRMKTHVADSNKLDETIKEFIRNNIYIDEENTGTVFGVFDQGILSLGTISPEYNIVSFNLFGKTITDNLPTTIDTDDLIDYIMERIHYVIEEETNRNMFHTSSLSN